MLREEPSDRSVSTVRPAASRIVTVKGPQASGAKLSTVRRSVGLGQQRTEALARTGRDSLMPLTGTRVMSSAETSAHGDPQPPEVAVKTETFSFWTKRIGMSGRFWVSSS